jgi:hypothetical protein
MALPVLRVTSNAALVLAAVMVKAIATHALAVRCGRDRCDASLLREWVERGHVQASQAVEQDGAK